MAGQKNTGGGARASAAHNRAFNELPGRQRAGFLRRAQRTGGGAARARSLFAASEQGQAISARERRRQAGARGAATRAANAAKATAAAGRGARRGGVRR